MPITRAAATYSLLFSTMVEARTVLAYWGQLDTPMADDDIDGKLIQGIDGHDPPEKTPSTRSAIRIAGKVIWISATRIIKALITPPAEPLISPKGRPESRRKGLRRTPRRATAASRR